MRSALLRSLVVAVPFAAGCIWTQFDDLESSSPITAIERPDGFPIATFGRNVIGFQYGYSAGESGAPENEPRVSRVAVSAGATSAVTVYAGWNGSDMALGAGTYGFCEKRNGECGGFIRDSIAAVRGDNYFLPELGQNTQGRLCVAVGGSVRAMMGSSYVATTQGTVLIRCERGLTSIVRALNTRADNTRFGDTLASVPPDSRVVASNGTTPIELVIGEPAPPNEANPGDSADGALHVLPNGSEAVRVDVSLPSELAAARGFADVLATASDGRGGFFVAAPMVRVGGKRGVLVLYAPSDRPAASTTIVRPVVWVATDDAPGRGAVLAFGDVVGDEAPDLVIGDAAGQTGRESAVFVHDGAFLAAITAASEFASRDASGWTRVDCPAIDGIACAGSGFGAALAIGDINGDGKGDLVVGAPAAEVGATLSGAVYVLPGAASGVGTGAVLLRTSRPSASAALGTSVATFESTDGRHEVVAGAPGDGAAYVFSCTPLAGDTQEVGPRCIPRAM